MRLFLIPWLLIVALLGAQPAGAVTLYTANACIPKPTPGDPASQNSWGTLLNTGANITDGLTSAVSTISVAGSSNVVLTFNCGTLDQTDAAQFVFTGVLTGNIYVLWPNARGRMFSVTNNTTGAFTLGLGVNNGASAPAGATATVPQGYTGTYYSDGTNVYSRVTSGGLTLAANSLPMNIQGVSGPGADVAVPACATALTYTIGSGFGCNAGGGGGGGGGTALAYGGVQTTSFVAVANTIYCVNTAGGVINMTLPATPVAGNQIVFQDCTGTFATNALTVLNNSNLLMGFNANMTVSTANAGATLLYNGATVGWRMF